MLQASTIVIRDELHALLDRAADLADTRGLARLRQVLLCLSEGGELTDFAVDVPHGLEHSPTLRRQSLAQDLLFVEPAGTC